jgi:hypothetical protein
MKAQTYCIPLTTTGCAAFGDFLNGFTFANISNMNSGCNQLNGNSYSYFNTLGPAQTMAGQSYSGTFLTNPTYSHGVAIWIDFNQNGTFETTERVYASTGTIAPNTNQPFTVTIPTTALPGVTRLRVRSVDFTPGTSIDPCLSYAFMEAEDYNVSILSGSVTNAWPGGLNFPGITANSVVLEVGQVFDGSSAAFPKPSVEIDRLNAPGFSQRFSYEIQTVNVAGQNAGTVMYEMRDPAAPASKTIPVAPGSTKITYSAQAAVGIMASGTTGTFTTVGAIGGTYKVVIKHELLNGTNVISTQNLEYPFNIAVNRDITVSSIESPLPARRQQYIGSVPVRARFMNVGKQLLVTKHIMKSAMRLHKRSLDLTVLSVVQILVEGFLQLVLQLLQ